MTAFLVLLMGLSSGPALTVPIIVEFTLQEKADMIAKEFEISSSTLRNLVYSESKWNPNADNGYDRGLVQISRFYHKDITDEMAFDVDYSLRYAAKKIKDDKAHEWTSCSCTKYAHVLLPAFPIQNADSVEPNSWTPEVGSIAVFRYKNSAHVAYITKLEADGFLVRETNLKPCLSGERKVAYNDEWLIGFWVPWYNISSSTYEEVQVVSTL